MDYTVETRNALIAELVEKVKNFYENENVPVEGEICGVKLDHLSYDYGTKSVVVTYLHKGLKSETIDNFSSSAIKDIIDLLEKTMNTKYHYQILIEGDGRGNYPAKTIDVYCKPNELPTIANAMVGYVYNFTSGGCCCIAKKDGDVSNRNFDILFSDCM
jgi:hypothetical protein